MKPFKAIACIAILIASFPCLAGAGEVQRCLNDPTPCGYDDFDHIIQYLVYVVDEVTLLPVRGAKLEFNPVPNMVVGCLPMEEVECGTYVRSNICVDESVTQVQVNFSDTTGNRYEPQNFTLVRNAPPLVVFAKRKTSYVDPRQYFKINLPNGSGGTATKMIISEEGDVHIAGTDQVLYAPGAPTVLLPTSDKEFLVSRPQVGTSNVDYVLRLDSAGNLLTRGIVRQRVGQTELNAPADPAIETNYVLRIKKGTDTVARLLTGVTIANSEDGQFECKGCFSNSTLIPKW